MTNFNIPEYEYIVTHDSSAHTDDMLAACVAVYLRPALAVHRVHEVTENDLQNPNVMVLDKGGRYEPELLNLDHHQDVNLSCAFILLMKTIGLLDELYEAFPWARVVDANDTGGMAKVAAKFNLPSSQQDLNSLGIIFSNPFASVLLSMFSDAKVIYPGTALHVLMTSIGEYIVEGCKAISERHRLLTDKVRIIDTAEGGQYADMLGLPQDGTDPSYGFGTWLSTQTPQPTLDCIVAHCPRNRGCVRLVRYNQNMDLRKYAVRYPHLVSFVHATGFLCCLKPGIVPDANDMVEIMNLCTDGK